MSAIAPRWTPWRPGPRRFLSVVCLLLFAAGAAAIVEEISRRRVIAETAARPGLPPLPPAVLATAGIVEESDGAALVVAEGLLDARDAATVPPAGSSEASRELVLEAVVQRPGSAHARLLLGRSAGTDSAALWKKPLELASTAAPGLDSAAVALAQRYLAVWLTLPAGERPTAEAAISRAFQEEIFLRAAFPLAVRRLGPDTAVRLVPNDRGALEAAYRSAKASGSLRALELLDERRKSAGPGEASRPGP